MERNRGAFLGTFLIPLCLVDLFMLNNLNLSGEGFHLFLLVNYSQNHCSNQGQLLSCPFFVSLNTE
jgi:hypothetical protein